MVWSFFHSKIKFKSDKKFEEKNENKIPVLVESGSNQMSKSVGGHIDAFSDSIHVELVPELFV